MVRLGYKNICEYTLMGPAALQYKTTQSTAQPSHFRLIPNYLLVTFSEHIELFDW